MWATPAASYCPGKTGELPKQNMMKSNERWDWKLCNKQTRECKMHLFWGAAEGDLDGVVRGGDHPETRDLLGDRV